MNPVDDILGLALTISEQALRIRQLQNKIGELEEFLKKENTAPAGDE